jgi:NIMA (never in mitosis gene a)-related kinase
VWRDKPYDYRSDIWSLGCVLYEMITLLPPFRATSMAGLSQKVVRGYYDPLPAGYSAELKEVVRRCLQVNHL